MRVQFDLDTKSEYRELFLAVRELLLSFAGFIETKKERITTYSNDKGGICHMRTMKHGIDIGFLKGARMEDKYELLTGSGKVMRVLQLYEFDEKHIRYYVSRAIEINDVR